MRDKLKDMQKTKDTIVKYTMALGVAVLVGTLIILMQGESPLAAFDSMIRGSLIGRASIARSIRWATPCIISGIAAVVAHKSGIINLGIEGQIYMGAFFAAVMGYIISVPKIIHFPLIIIAAGVGAMLLALIPAILKLYFDISEMITTLMLNYVAILLTEYLTMQLMDVDGATAPDYVATPPMEATSRLSTIIPSSQATTGIFIALFIVTVVFLMYKYTIKGYEFKQVGENINFAHYGGVKAATTYFVVFLLSSFIAGICGAVEMMGPHGRFRAQFSSNLGWDGIMIALIAKNNPIGTVIVAILWGITKNGSFAMERMTNVNRLVVTLIQALFVLFITMDHKKLLGFIRSLFKTRQRAEQKGGTCDA